MEILISCDSLTIFCLINEKVPFESSNLTIFILLDMNVVKLVQILHSAFRCEGEDFVVDLTSVSVKKDFTFQREMIPLLQRTVLLSCHQSTFQIRKVRLLRRVATTSSITTAPSIILKVSVTFSLFYVVCVFRSCLAVVIL